eukprot:scaffold15128_cov476-Alexandrium_tamarense.AAC.1
MLSKYNYQVGEQARAKDIESNPTQIRNYLFASKVGRDCYTPSTSNCIHMLTWTMTSCTLKMQPNDGCFVLRSDGTFTFAIVIGKDWGEGHIDLLVDMFGSAKRVSLKHWSNSIRAVPLIDNGNEKGTSSTVADTSQANDDTTNEPSEEIHHSKRSEQSSIHQTDSLKTILVETISFRKKGVHPSKPESILRRSKSDP